MSRHFCFETEKFQATDLHMSKSIHSESFAPRDLTPQRVERMFKLMQRYYHGVARQQFLSDLEAKDVVVLVLDEQGEVVGFSTLVVWEEQMNGQKIQIVFSGDTIIEQAYWGSTVFAGEWLRRVARIKEMQPETPLYWFLIVKGHRTYRHLDVFAFNYFPRFGSDTPKALKDVMDKIATKRFGNAYSAQTGLIRFLDQQARLRPEWAAIPEKDKGRPEVAFFLQQNPGYAEGDELVCLAEISADNLKPFARRIFEMAMG
jgi:hypothetical protein